MRRIVLVLMVLFALNLVSAQQQLCYGELVNDEGLICEDISEGYCSQWSGDTYEEIDGQYYQCEWGRDFDDPEFACFDPNLQQWRLDITDQGVCVSGNGFDWIEYEHCFPLTYCNPCGNDYVDPDEQCGEPELLSCASGFECINCGCVDMEEFPQGGSEVPELNTTSIILIIAAIAVGGVIILKKR